MRTRAAKLEQDRVTWNAVVNNADVPLHRDRSRWESNLPEYRYPANGCGRESVGRARVACCDAKKLKKKQQKNKKKR